MGLKYGMYLAVLGAILGIAFGPPGILAGAMFGAGIGWSIDESK